MKFLRLIVIAICLCLSAQQASAQSPQITIGAVLNAATYAADEPLAPGVIFSIFGSSLTDGTTGSASQVPLPTSLAGASVLVNGVAAPIFFSSPSQINAQFPVDLGEAASASIQVQVQAA